MNRSILVVADDARVCASLPAAVAQEARSIRVAEDGESALAAIASDGPAALPRPIAETTSARANVRRTMAPRRR